MKLKQLLVALVTPLLVAGCAAQQPTTNADTDTDAGKQYQKELKNKKTASDSTENPKGTKEVSLDVTKADKEANSSTVKAEAEKKPAKNDQAQKDVPETVAELEQEFLKKTDQESTAKNEGSDSSADQPTVRVINGQSEGSDTTSEQEDKTNEKTNVAETKQPSSEQSEADQTIESVDAEQLTSATETEGPEEKKGLSKQEGPEPKPSAGTDDETTGKTEQDLTDVTLDGEQDVKQELKRYEELLSEAEGLLQKIEKQQKKAKKELKQSKEISSADIKDVSIDKTSNASTVTRPEPSIESSDSAKQATDKTEDKATDKTKDKATDERKKQVKSGGEIRPEPTTEKSTDKQKKTDATKKTNDEPATQDDRINEHAYTVQSGDVLSLVAKSKLAEIYKDEPPRKRVYQMVDKIKQANPELDPDTLSEGQQITIPSFSK